jgi:aspartyl-tRNA(Asn)/glutamyl-tRNA(Gln) amidotransferase subunit A
MDSTTPDQPVPDYSAGLSAQGGKGASLKGLKIGLPKEYFVPGTDKEVSAAVQSAIEDMKKLGAEFCEISLPHSKYGLAAYYIICPSEVSSNMERYDGIRFGPGPSKDGEDLLDYYLTARGEGFGDEMKRRIMIGTYALSAGYYDAYYLKAQKVRTLVKRDFEKAFEGVDAILTPTTPSTAFKIGANSNDPMKMYLEDIFTVSVNIAGVPAMSVPCGLSKAGLPIGLQLIGPQFGEGGLLKIGAAYQGATEWHKKRAQI